MHGWFDFILKTSRFWQRCCTVKQSWRTGLSIPASNASSDDTSLASRTLRSRFFWKISSYLRISICDSQFIVFRPLRSQSKNKKVRTSLLKKWSWKKYLDGWFYFMFKTSRSDDEGSSHETLCSRNCCCRCRCCCSFWGEMDTSNASSDVTSLASRTLSSRPE